MLETLSRINGFKNLKRTYFAFRVEYQTEALYKQTNKQTNNTVGFQTRAQTVKLKYDFKLNNEHESPSPPQKKKLYQRKKLNRDRVKLVFDSFLGIKDKSKGDSRRLTSFQKQPYHGKIKFINFF